MRSFLSSLKVAGVVTACLVSGSAFANIGGITGRSGKQGLGCEGSGCHAPVSNKPTVELQGPTTLEKGATGNYTLIVRGGPGVQAGFNVAIDGGGTLNTGGAGQLKVVGELTHSTPKSFSGGEARFDFSLVAPASDATVKVFAAGNSVNGDGEDTGDSFAQTTASIKVGAGGSNGDGGGDDGGGCAAAAGMPLLGAGLLLLGARFRRRRA